MNGADRMLLGGRACLMEWTASLMYVQLLKSHQRHICFEKSIHLTCIVQQLCVPNVKLMWNFSFLNGCTNDQIGL